jgi:hypothetical protein
MRRVTVRQCRLHLGARLSEGHIPGPWVQHHDWWAHQWGSDRVQGPRPLARPSLVSLPVAAEAASREGVYCGDMARAQAVEAPPHEVGWDRTSQD